MRIAFFTTGMTRGGAERVIATLSNQLVQMGHEALIIMLKGQKSEYRLDEKVKLLSANLDAGMRNAPAAMRFYCRTVRAEHPDVVIAFTLKPNLMTCLAKTALRLKTPLIISERANPFQRRESIKLLFNKLFRVADLNVCQSKVISCYYEGGINAVPSIVIPNPIDEACIADKPSARRGNFIISVGRLCKQKRQDLAIRAFAEIASLHPGLRLKICGEGEAFDHLQILASELDVGGSVDFCGSVNNVMRTYSDAAAYLMTSDFEGFPNALIEAIASGIPVVSTDFSPGVARELVHDGVNGYVVPAGDVLAVKAGLERILANEPDRRRLEQSACAVRERFALDKIAGEWLMACNLVIEGSR